MSSIRDIKAPWREALLPASFRGVMFHVEAGTQESGRRVVNHEFPKRNEPYAEDMGRRSREFNVRGYLISYPKDTSSNLYKKDYRINRNALIAALEADGPATLQLPLLRPLRVMVTRYRITEEEKLGGYCAFDMGFSEFGKSPYSDVRQSTEAELTAASQALKQEVLRALGGAEKTSLLKGRELPALPRPRPPAAPA